MNKVKMLEAHVGTKEKQVANLKVDASKIEAVKQLKGNVVSHIGFRVKVTYQTQFQFMFTICKNQAGKLRFKAKTFEITFEFSR